MHHHTIEPLSHILSFSLPTSVSPCAMVITRDRLAVASNNPQMASYSLDMFDLTERGESTQCTCTHVCSFLVVWNPNDSIIECSCHSHTHTHHQIPPLTHTHTIKLLHTHTHTLPPPHTHTHTLITPSTHTHTHTALLHTHTHSHTYHPLHSHTNTQCRTLARLRAVIVTPSLVWMLVPNCACLPPPLWTRLYVYGVMTTTRCVCCAWTTLPLD